jgi:hypothetical protein
LQKPQDTDVSSASLAETVGNQGRTAAMKNPMSNIVFGMAILLFQTGTFGMLFRMRRLQGD